MKLIIFAVCLVTVITALRPPLNETPSYCLEGADNGLCKACMIRYYYNVKSRRCEPFVYSGCGGNENNFVSYGDCKRGCIPKKNLLNKMVKRSCLLCRKHMDERLLCCTTTKSHHTVVLLSSLVLFNVIDLEEARRCYATCVRMRQRFCNVHYIEAAKFITSEMTYLGIGFASYVDEPRGVVVSYVNEKDIPLHVVDSVQTNAMKLDVELVISKRRICEFLNYCLARFKADEIRAPVCADSADSNQKTVGSPIKTEDHSGDVKPPATEFGTSSPPQVIEAKGDLSAVELYTDPEAISPSIKAENDISDVKPPAFPSGTSSAPEMIEVKVDNSAKECVDSTVENREETNPALLKKVFAVSGERLLTLFRFCPECGTEISRKRSAVLSEEGPSPVVHFVCKNCQGKQSWYGM